MKKGDLYVLACNIRSLHNLGSIFRTCDGAGVTKVFLAGDCGTPPRKEITKTALGADCFVDWEYHRDPVALVRRLRTDGIQIVSLERNARSQNIGEYSPKFPLCMIVGSEKEGVSDSLLQLSDQILHIPMRGKKESLNVSVAFGVAVYQLTESRTT